MKLLLRKNRITGSVSLRMLAGALAPWLTLTPAFAQVADTISLDDVQVSARRQPIKSQLSVENRDVIGKGELLRAACCNLGESFTTNPSVDVSYSDAATGARQIRLLGLSGTYVQMLQENVPAFRASAIPYALSYVPGTWMQSIQVSKGAASVKNGYESVTGQINIEYIKPQGLEGVHGNLFYDTNRRLEANADGSVHLGENLSTALLLHYEDASRDHDANGDGFMDMPKMRAYNVMDRWAWVSRRYISQLSVRYLNEERTSGTSSHHHNADGTASATSGTASTSGLNGTASTSGFSTDRYTIGLKTTRVEGQWKNAIFLRTDKNESVALMLKGVYHDMDDTFGIGSYNVNQKNAYAQLLYEVDFSERHNLSAGASVNHDYLDEQYMAGFYAMEAFGSAYGSGSTGLTSAGSAASSASASAASGVGGADLWANNPIYCGTWHETTSGLYAQYTYKAGSRFVAMAGLRYDYSSQFGGFFTPRLHLKYAPSDIVTLRLAAGKGYRTPHPLAENVSYMASSRQMTMGSDGQPLQQEEAWNMGASLALNIPLGSETLALNADYYYTHFVQQTVMDLDHTGRVLFYNLPDGGRSYSHVTQADATYPVLPGLSLTLAFRYQEVKATQYAGGANYDRLGSSNLHFAEVLRSGGTVLRTRPLTPRYKALATASWKSPLELWQVDVTYSWNGSGRMPLSATDANGEPYWPSHYKAFGQLQAQLTRDFRYCSVYVGGENLTGFKQKNPIVCPDNPYGPMFDASMVWGPTDGAMGYVGVRLNFEKF